ncbi:MAG: hypothetical protein ABFS12_09385 [Bacteroidota bacterium]
MGRIVYWGLIRITIMILLLWISYEYFYNRYWWIIAILAFYIFVIHPLISQYKIFKEENREVIVDSLCSTCKHFDETAILCLKYDKHPTNNFTPCEGIDWEVK